MRLTLVNEAKVDMDPYKVTPEVLSPKPALNMQSFLLVLPISETLRVFSPEFAAGIRGQLPGFIYLWCAGYQPSCSKTEGESL